MYMYVLYMYIYMVTPFHDPYEALLLHCQHNLLHSALFGVRSLVYLRATKLQIVFEHCSVLLHPSSHDPNQKNAQIWIGGVEHIHIYIYI